MPLCLLKIETGTVPIVVVVNQDEFASISTTARFFIVEGSDAEQCAAEHVTIIVVAVDRSDSDPLLPSVKRRPTVGQHLRGIINGML